MHKDNFKSFVKCFICKLNEELNYSLDFNTLSEIEIFDLFLEYKLSDLDIEKRKFENSNNVGGLIITIAIGLFTCLVAKVFIKKSEVLDKFLYLPDSVIIILVY